MSGISDYTSLLVDVGDYGGRNDIAHLFPRFIGLAEAKFNRDLRVSDMETVGTVTVATGSGTLPADFLEARMVLSPNGMPINAWSLSALINRYRNYGGMPAAYAVVGNTIEVRPTADGDLTMTYYGKIPPLTPANPVNWLLNKAPDAYLYGLLEEIAIWQQDADKAASVNGLKEQALKGLRRNDEAARWGNGEVSLGCDTP